MFKVPLVWLPRFCCTISYPLSSLRINCCVRAESQPQHSSLTVKVWLTVCLPPLLYIETNVYSCLPLVSRGPSLRHGCLFSVIAIFVPLVVPSVSHTPLFWRSFITHRTHRVPGRIFRWLTCYCFPQGDVYQMRTTTPRNTHTAENTRSDADVNLCVLKIKALSLVISLSLSRWNWLRCRQPNLNKSFIVE